MENRVDYNYKAEGNYEIRLVRRITIHPESNWISFDTTSVQYLRFLSIEQAQNICYMLGIKEYEIIEYGPNDLEHWGHYETVYRTPLIQQAEDALAAQHKAKDLQTQLTRLENRKTLESLPKKELIRTFSNGFKLIRLINEGKDKIYCHYSFINNNLDTKVEREFYLSHYITRGTNRFRKKLLLEDLSRWGITGEEANELIILFDSLRTRQNELNNMII